MGKIEQEFTLKRKKERRKDGFNFSAISSPYSHRGEGGDVDKRDSDTRCCTSHLLANERYIQRMQGMSRESPERFLDEPRFATKTSPSSRSQSGK